MTGSSLMDFLISLVLLAAMVGLFFAVIPKVSPDEAFSKIARIAIGVFALVLFLLAVKAVLFGGGAAIALSPMGLLTIAIAFLVVLVVVYLINWGIDYFLGPEGASWVVPLKYVIGAVALIALLSVAAYVLEGGAVHSFRLR